MLSSLSLTNGSLPPTWLQSNCSNRFAETSELLQGVLPLYLIAGQQPVLCADSWAILAHSPDMSRYKQFLKCTAIAPLHFMPPFELEELMQLRPWVLPRQEALTQDMVRVCSTPGQNQGCTNACSIVTHASGTCPS